MAAQENRPTCLYYYSVLFFVLLMVASLLPSSSFANSDSDALFAFKQVLHDPLGVLSSWDHSPADPCAWHYVSCDESNRVIRLDLQQKSLSGPLIPQLGRLSSLKFMELFGNRLTGRIPPEFGQLTNLIALDLFENNLGGSIPPQLGQMPNLVFLRLMNNSLSGAIPPSLATLPKLVIFDVSNNRLTGPIPNVGSFASLPADSFAGNPGLCGEKIKKQC